MTDEEATFLRAILSGDPAAPLIYADWLEERDEFGDAVLAADLRTSVCPRSLVLQAFEPADPNAPIRRTPASLPWVIREPDEASDFISVAAAREHAARWREVFQCGDEIREHSWRPGAHLVAVFDGWLKIARNDSRRRAYTML